MASPPIVETFDEREGGIARFGLCLEPAAIEKLAFERGEEALAHGIVVCVADRTHRGAHAGVPAAVAELDRALVGVVDHAPGLPRHQCHVQSVKHQLRGERGTHRPANDAATVRIEHDSEIQRVVVTRWPDSRRIDDPGKQQGKHKVSTTIAIGTEDTIQTDLARRA